MQTLEVIVGTVVLVVVLGLLLSLPIWLLWNRSEEHTSNSSHSQQSRMPSSA